MFTCYFRLKGAFNFFKFQISYTHTDTNVLKIFVCRLFFDFLIWWQCNSNLLVDWGLCKKKFFKYFFWFLAACYLARGRRAFIASVSTWHLSIYSFKKKKLKISFLKVIFGQFDCVPKNSKNKKIGKNYKQMFQSIRLMVESTIEQDSNEELQCFLFHPMVDGGHWWREIWINF